MQIITRLTLLFFPTVVSRLASGAAVDRYESDRQRHTAVINFMDTTKDRKAEDESTGVGATTVEYGQEGEEEEEEYDDEYYDEDEYEDGMSGDYEMELPRGKTIYHHCCNSVFKWYLEKKTMKCNDNVFFGFSRHVEQTQRPVCHPGDRKH